MSGGHFDYREFSLEVIADQIAELIENNNTPDEWGYANDYSDETIRLFKETADMLRKLAYRVHRIDYLVSGDDGEETFLEKWEADRESDD